MILGAGLADARLAMDAKQHMIDARRLWPGELLYDGPLAVVDLDRTPREASTLSLPPCPVVGVGEISHPLAPQLDAVIEAPVSLDTVVRHVLAMPHAAAVFVQLLRLIEDMPVDAALTTESLAYAVLQGSTEHATWISAQHMEKPVRSAPGRVRLERSGDRLLIVLDDPANGNAIDRAMRDELHDAFALAALDATIVEVSLRAEGRTFSLGAALEEFGTTVDPATAHAIRWHTLPARQACRCAGKLDVWVRGGCVGSGLELAAWASRLTASHDAWFQLPELAMGILPGAGGCVSLSRRIGRQRTALMVLSGKRLSAKAALAWGLVDAIVDDQT